MVAAVSMGSTSEGEIAVLAGSGGLEAVLVLVAAPSVAAAALVAAASVVSVEQDWAQVVSQDSVVAASVVTIAQPPSAGRAWATICRVSRVQTKGALDGNRVHPRRAESPLYQITTSRPSKRIFLPGVVSSAEGVAAACRGWDPTTGTIFSSMKMKEAWTGSLRIATNESLKVKERMDDYNKKS